MARSGLRMASTPWATIFSASMSRPESVSSRMASFGSSTAICRISLRFFSPPEKPSFTERFISFSSMFQQLQFLPEQGQEIHGINLVHPTVFADGIERRPEEVSVADAGNLYRVLEGHEDAFTSGLLRFHSKQILAVVRHLARGDRVGLAA